MAKTGLLLFFLSGFNKSAFLHGRRVLQKKNLLVQRRRVKLIGTVCLDASKQSNIKTLDTIQIESAGIW